MRLALALRAYAFYGLRLQVDDSNVHGLDAFLEIDTWQSYSDLLKQVVFIVIARPIIDCQDLSSRWKRLENFLESILYSFQIEELDRSDVRIVFWFDN